MSNNLTMPFHRVINKLRLAEGTAFIFSNIGKRLKKLSDHKKETMQHIGGKVSPFWVFMSVAGIVAAIGFGIYAAFNAQGAIAGIVDPMGNGILPLWTYFVIGAAISIVGMLFGHLIYEGLSGGFKTDQYTGQKLPTSKIWLAVVGFIGAIFYIGYQFYLVKSAGNGSNTLVYMPYVVAGISIIELLVGALILHRAFAYMLLFFTSIIMGIVTRQMNANARHTNNNYRDYLTFLNAYNSENPANRMEVEGNDNIRRAIAYYTGTSLPKEDTGNINTPQAGNNSSDNTPNNGTMQNQDERRNQEATQQNLDAFLNDTIDEDLTA